MSELKPCPFCGCKGEEVELRASQIVSGWTIVHCPCGAEADGEDEWNTRHIPEGYKLVPVEPTEAMIIALEEGYTTDDRYKAMLEAVE